MVALEEKSVLEMVQSGLARGEVNPDEIIKIIKNIEKYEALIDKVSGLIARLNRLGVIPAIIRVAGKKMDIPDIDKPIQNPLMIIATTPLHYTFYEQLNQLDEKQVKDVMITLQQLSLKAQKRMKREEKKKEAN
jgi:hypothetical protein